MRKQIVWELEILFFYYFCANDSLSSPFVSLPAVECSDTPQQSLVESRKGKYPSFGGRKIRFNTVGVVWGVFSPFFFFFPLFYFPSFPPFFPPFVSPSFFFSHFFLAGMRRREGAVMSDLRFPGIRAVCVRMEVTGILG